jgi:hypothetical protein
LIQVVGEALGEVSNQLRDEIEKTVASKLEQASNQKLAAMVQASFEDLKQEIKKIRGGLAPLEKFEQADNGERRTTQVPQLDAAEQSAEQLQALEPCRVALATRGNPGLTDAP